MKVIITGVTGFIGGALAKAMVAAGKPVTGLVRPNSGKADLAEPGIQAAYGDVLDPASLDGLIDPGDWVVHAAGMLGQWGAAEQDYYDLHVDGSRHVLSAANAAGAARILYISSPGVLGPIQGQAADELAPLAPSNPYERSKAAAENMVLEMAAEGLPVVIVRPEFVYGPGDLHVLGLFQAVKSGMFFYVGGGTAVCHPTYIEDAVDGMLLCLEKGRPGEIYHITGPRPVTFREYGRAIAAALDVRTPWLSLPKPVALAGALGVEAAVKLTGKPPPISRTGVAFFSENRRFSWDKARRELGYRPQVDLAEGVRRTADWYQSQNLL